LPHSSNWPAIDFGSLCLTAIIHLTNPPRLNPQHLKERGLTGVRLFATDACLGLGYHPASVLSG
jgi:hypothetical protein